MEHPVSVEMRGAFGEVAACVDRATVGREIALVAMNSIPQLASQMETELMEETVLAATSNVAAIIEGLLNGTEPDQVPVPAGSLRWVDWLVARNIDTSTIPWAYTFGNGRMADALREIVSGLDLPGDERWTLGEGLTRYVQAYVEHVSAALVDYHVREHQKWHSGLGAHRRLIVQRLLAGELVDIHGAATELNYDLARPHLAAVIWSDAEPGAEPSQRARESAGEMLLRSCGAERILTISNPDGSTWAWGQGDALGDAAADGPLEEAGMLGAIGTVAAGRRGFRSSHEDAQHARRVAVLLGRRSRSVVSYRSVALTALVAHDAEQALRFVESELGSLTDDSDSARRIRATLAVYLEEGQRPVRAARRLGIHQNTVAYRVTQAEEAIGRSVSERRLEIETALRLVDALDALRVSTRGR